MTNTVIKKTLEEDGFFIGLNLDPNELRILKNFISTQCFDILKKNNINTQLDIEDYHKLPNSHHAIMWRDKKCRTLNAEAVNQIKQFSFFRELKKEFPSMCIYQPPKLGREEMYFRICRPNQSLDFGPLHADAWFWELGHDKLPEGKKVKIKVWIAVCTEKRLNGLRYVPKSHQKYIPYHGVKKEGFDLPKPQIDIEEAQLDVQLFHSNSGDIFIFHDRLIHGGAENKGQYTRVSLEFTILV